MTSLHAQECELLRALPVQLISLGHGVVLVRGAAEIHIGGERAVDIVPQLLDAASGSGAFRRTLVEQFARSDWDKVDALIGELIRRSIFIKANATQPTGSVESSLDVFYWHFGQTSQDAISKISSKSIALMGVNSISRRIALALQPLGIDCVKVVDFELLRNLSLFDSNGQLLDSEWPLAKPLDYQTWQEGLADDDLSCLVATSDFGGPQLMQEWNRFCVESDIYFLAVVLHRLVGTIGPFVIPRETACYECMRLRENSNMLDPGIERAAEDSAPERQAITGFHPSMLNVLGELAALELCKFYGGTSWRADHIIEVNLLVPSVVSRRVLKLPLCPVCSDAAKLSRTNIERGSPIPGNEPEEFDMR